MILRALNDPKSAFGSVRLNKGEYFSSFIVDNLHDETIACKIGSKVYQ